MVVRVVLLLGVWWWVRSRVQLFLLSMLLGVGAGLLVLDIHHRGGRRGLLCLVAVVF